MKLTRRHTILGATSLAVGLPMIANSKPIYPESPFLKVFTNDATLTRVNLNRMHEEQPAYPISYDQHVIWYQKINQFYADRADTYSVSTMDGVSVNSVEEAEDILLKNQGNPSMTCYPQIGPPPIFVGEPATPLEIFVNRACNLIHMRVRLTRGDTLLLSPKAMDRLHPYNGFLSMSKQMVGRWQQVGMLHHTVRVFVGEHLADDQVYIIATKDDNHALLVQSDGGLHLVTDPRNISGSSPISLDYFSNIGMVYET